VKVLAATGVTGYPFVRADPHPNPGSEDAPLGIRVTNATLLNLNAYLARLEAPPGADVDAPAATRGRQLFRTAGCTNCHNVDQSKFVPPFIVPMKTIFPGDNPVVLAQREPPLNPIVNTPPSIFDDTMAVVNASLRGEVRRIAMPLLLDLARKPVFLHDNSVATLDDLLDPKRGATAFTRSICPIPGSARIWSNSSRDSARITPTGDKEPETPLIAEVGDAYLVTHPFSISPASR